MRRFKFKICLLLMDLFAFARRSFMRAYCKSQDAYLWSYRHALDNDFNAAVESQEGEGGEVPF